MRRILLLAALVCSALIASVQAAPTSSPPPTEQPAEPEPVAATPSDLQQKLGERNIDVELRNLPLEQAMDRLRGHGVNIFVHWQSLHEMGVTPQTPVSVVLRGVSLGTVLTLTLEAASDGLGWAVHDGVIVVGSRPYLDSRVTMRLYDVSDLVRHRRQQPSGEERPQTSAEDATEDAMSEVRSVVMQMAGSDITTAVYGDLLAVRTSLLGHAGVEEALMRLRERLRQDKDQEPSRP